MESTQGRVASGATATAPKTERREKRLHVAVPVKLFLDPSSASYQLCCTYEIAILGARLVAVAGVTKTGQIIWLQRHNRRAKYKVVWIGKPGTQQAEQIGVELLEPNIVIWENELQMRINRQ